MTTNSEQRSEESLICPHCGYDVNTPSVEISEDDKQEYFRRMLSGEPFSKTYTYMKGDVEIELTELSSSEADNLVNLIRTIDDDNMVLIYAFRAKFLACCTMFKVGDRILINKADKDLKNPALVDKAYRKFLGDAGSVVASLADDALKEFSTLLEGAIQYAVTSKDF